MKITPHDLQALAARIVPLDTPERRAAYNAGQFPYADRVKCLNKRYRWDLLYLSGLTLGDGRGAPGDINLYSYLDDTHIDTALCHIVPSLGESK